MVRFPLLRPVCLLALAAGAAVLAQSANDPARLKPVPPLSESVPFTPDAVQMAHSIEIRPADTMTTADRLLLANAESSIAESAGRGGIDFGGGGWSYEQLLCPALPNHLFLRYRCAAGTGSETEFSASIPRNGEGRVRIIPIRRRGYSLFSPAPVNALTIAAFNRIRAEEPEVQRATGWLGNALCYAALAGARPQLSPADAAPAPGHSVLASGASLHVKNTDGEVIQFTDAAATPHPTLWTMTFARNGKLMKAVRGPAPVTATRTVPKVEPVAPRSVPRETPAVVKAVPGGVSAPARPVPQAQ